MKTIGLIGGLSWFSTKEYYQKLNEVVNEKLGSAHSAKILLYSIDLEEFKTILFAGDLEKLTEFFIHKAKALEAAGAECIMIASNTPHIIADRLKLQLTVPLIHIVEATANEIQKINVKKVALLGTIFTMNNPFYKDILAQFGIEMITPTEADKAIVDDKIVHELTKGIFTAETKSQYLAVIERLKESGAEGVILGCTEIPMLIADNDASIPVFDTMVAHVNAAVEFALGD